VDTGVLKKEVLWRNILNISGYLRVNGTTTAMAAWPAGIVSHLLRRTGKTLDSRSLKVRSS